jgi:hypothetical protein
MTSSRGSSISTVRVFEPVCARQAWAGVGRQRCDTGQVSAPDEPLEILVLGPPEPEPRRRAALAVVMLTLSALLAGGWYLDFHRRQSEFAAVTRCADRADAAATDAAARVDAMAAYVRPSLALDLDSTVNGLYGMVARVAAGTGDGLQQAREACAGIAVISWHDKLRAAQAAQLSYLDSARELLRQTAGDGRAWFDHPPDLPQLHRTAVAALSAAAPHPPWS